MKFRNIEQEFVLLHKLLGCVNTRKEYELLEERIEEILSLTFSSHIHRVVRRCL